MSGSRLDRETDGRLCSEVKFLNCVLQRLCYSTALLDFADNPNRTGKTR